MSKHLRNDLEKLEKRLLFLGGRAESAVRKSIIALKERRTDLAQEVIEGDATIDQEEVEIEEECLKILALHQPVAADLRFIAACLKINSDLERIGDLATSIAKRSAALADRSPLPLPPSLDEMTEACTSMLHDSLDAFVEADADKARAVMQLDDEVDRFNRVIIDHQLDAMKHDPSRIDQAVLLFSVSKNLERIADHATNIAEDVIYVVGGEIVRHHGGD